MGFTSDDIKRFILENIENHPSDISGLTGEKFSISRQAVHLHLKNLEEEGVVSSEGSTRNKKYFLRVIFEKNWSIPISAGLQEDRIWREYIEPLMKELNTKPNVNEVCHYGFTEMVNNVLDHSVARTCTIHFGATAKSIRMFVSDDGVGIFEKIKQAYHLEDHRHAILELAKGKVTVDPEKHTGEGIFFSTRMFDHFTILSGKLYYSRKSKGDDWLIEDRELDQSGTSVMMKIDRNSSRTTKEVFDEFTSEASNYGFTKTHVPVKLAIYGHENLISRSQAKRLLARFDKFREVLLDFDGVEKIGQAFADEIFRVYKNEHPAVEIIGIRTNEEVKKMIQRTQSGGLSDQSI